MRAKVTAVFLGSETRSFKDKSTGEEVVYRKASFSVRDEMETFVLSIPRDLDASVLKQFTDSYLLVDFRYDAKYNNFKGRLINCYATEKDWLSSPALSQAEASATPESRI